MSSARDDGYDDDRSSGFPERVVGEEVGFRAEGSEEITRRTMSRGGRDAQLRGSAASASASRAYIPQRPIESMKDVLGVRETP